MMVIIVKCREKAHQLGRRRQNDQEVEYLMRCAVNVKGAGSH